MTQLFIIAGVLFFLTWLAKNPIVKGMIGEFLINLYLNKNLDKQTYRLMKNIMIHDKEGGTTQIDHLVLSPYGIFVIETKNLRGWIFGDKNSPQWTQQIFKSKHKFQNPFRQNYKHIMCLCELTGLPEDAFSHIIVFVGDCTIKTRDKLPDSLVVSGRELVKYMETFTTPRFTAEEIDTIQNTILGGKIANTIKHRKEHIAHVNEIIENKNQTPSCPRCGQPMLQRQIKSGEKAGQTFWGCSKYPKCRCVVDA